MGVLAGLKIAGIVVVGLAIISVYVYVTSLQSSLAVSQANNSKLEQAVSIQTETIKRIKKDFTEIRIFNAELNMKSEQLQTDINKLNNKFNIRANGRSRDFGAISRAKPELISKIINRATTNVNRCLELATGAELKQGEQNNECENLINSITP